MNGYRSTRACLRIIRNYSIKPQVTFDQEVSTDIQNEKFKPRNHPGRIKPTSVIPPEALVKAITNIIEDYPANTLTNDAVILGNYLHARRPPIEENEYKAIHKETVDQVVQRTEPIEIATENDSKRLRQSIKDKVSIQMKAKVYNWKSINYNVYNSLLYLFARFPPEYAALMRIFSEISTRDPSFKPRSYFDFGAGTGTGMWAVNNFWRSDIFEYFNVDSSRDMNDLSQLLLQGGKGNKQGNIKGVFYRQFLPANNVSYDLVVCAYSLMELPSRKARLQTLLNLWNKTAQYLVVVETGSKFGFRLVNEARDFILNLENQENSGHVFSPCPHDLICPKFVLDNNIPCNFNVNYHTIPISGTTLIKTELYSYVVLKRRKRSSGDLQWPRLVEQPLVKSKHAICRSCTSKGTLQEVIFTASKHGKTVYHCARSSKWGDLLPMTIETDDN